MVVGFEDIKGIASMCYSNTAHSKRFSRLAGLLPLLGLDLTKVELEFLALKMEKNLSSLLKIPEFKQTTITLNKIQFKF